MNREEANKYVNELLSLAENQYNMAVDRAKDIADEHGLTFFIEGRGQYYGRSHPQRFNESGNTRYLYDGWDESACWLEN